MFIVTCVWCLNLGVSFTATIPSRMQRQQQLPNKYHDCMGRRTSRRHLDWSLYQQRPIVQTVVVDVDSLYNNDETSHSFANTTTAVNNDASGSTPPKRLFMYMTPEQDRLLRDKGDREAFLMSQSPQTPLKAFKVKRVKSTVSGSNSKGGFGSKPNASSGKKKQSKPSFATTINSQETSSSTPSIFEMQAPAYVQELHTEGLVRIDGVLSPELCKNLREYLIDLRARSTQAIEQGTLLDSQDRFADVLLNQNRCDLKVPLGPPPVMQALAHLLNPHYTPLRSMIQHVFDPFTNNAGHEATLYELNCFMSNAGARRQLVHADNVFGPPPSSSSSSSSNNENEMALLDHEPALVTCFVALQDIDETMGPTIWIPRTHNRPSHEEFYAPDSDTTQQRGDTTVESSKERLLRTSPSVVGTLPQGSCVVFDPRTLHCASANACADPTHTRALFYFSFKNPRVDDPGCPSCSGYGLVDAELTLHELCSEMDEARHGFSRRLEILSCFP
jgi:hypothetical protein